MSINMQLEILNTDNEFRICRHFILNFRLGFRVRMLDFNTRKLVFNIMVEQICARVIASSLIWQILEPLKKMSITIPGNCNCIVQNRKYVTTLSQIRQMDYFVTQQGQFSL